MGVGPRSGVAAAVAAAQTQQPRGVCAAGLCQLLVLTTPAILCGTRRKGGALLVTLYWSLVPLGANRWAHHSSMAHCEHALCSWAADTWVSIQITGQCAHNVWLCVHVWHHGCVVALQGGPVVSCRLPELSGCGVSCRVAAGLCCAGGVSPSCILALQLYMGWQAPNFPGTLACLPACVTWSIAPSGHHLGIIRISSCGLWLLCLYGWTLCTCAGGHFVPGPWKQPWLLFHGSGVCQVAQVRAVPVCVGPSTECGAPASVAGRTGARCGCIISLLGATAVQYACARVVDECNMWHAALPTDCLHTSVLHTCVHGTYNTQPWYICPLCRLPPAAAPVAPMPHFGARLVM